MLKVYSCWFILFCFVLFSVKRSLLLRYWYYHLIHIFLNYWMLLFWWIKRIEKRYFCSFKIQSHMFSVERMYIQIFPYPSLILISSSFPLTFIWLNPHLLLSLFRHLFISSHRHLITFSFDSLPISPRLPSPPPQEFHPELPVVRWVLQGARRPPGPPPHPPVPLRAVPLRGGGAEAHRPAHRVLTPHTDVHDAAWGTLPHSGQWHKIKQWKKCFLFLKKNLFVYLIHDTWLFACLFVYLSG